MHPTLAAVNYTSPLFWAVLIGWIISVILHEFAHGIVAYWGGDYTIRERGGLTLNPLQYVDPVTTILLPIVFMAMGGVPLMGGSTYVRTDLLRSRLWRSAVALAGPFTNLILFFVCAIPLSPRVGWIHPTDPMDSWTSAQMFCAAMAALQLIAVQINIIPLPPLDGFNAIDPYLPDDIRRTVRQPQVRMALMLGLFFVLSSSKVGHIMFDHLYSVLTWLRFDDDSLEFVRRSFNTALFGYTS